MLWGRLLAVGVVPRNALTAAARMCCGCRNGSGSWRRCEQVPKSPKNHQEWDVDTVTMETKPRPPRPRAGSSYASGDSSVTRGHSCLANLQSHSYNCLTCKTTLGLQLKCLRVHKFWGPVGGGPNTKDKPVSRPALFVQVQFLLASLCGD